MLMKFSDALLFLTISYASDRLLLEICLFERFCIYMFVLLRLSLFWTTAASEFSLSYSYCISLFTVPMMFLLPFFKVYIWFWELIFKGRLFFNFDEDQGGKIYALSLALNVDLLSKPVPKY